MPLTLGEKQRKFTRMIGELIAWAYANGFQLTFGEAHRPQVTADWYASQGKGIKNSLHTKRLAVDFNVFKNGEFLTSGDQFKALGEFWESIGGTWGGRFNDGNHFSLEHEGVK